MKIQRYRINSYGFYGSPMPPEEVKDDSGPWVDYDDHSTALSSLQAKHDRLREALTACIAYMKDQRSYEVYRATLDAAELALADEVTDER